MDSSVYRIPEFGGRTDYVSQKIKRLRSRFSSKAKRHNSALGGRDGAVVAYQSTSNLVIFALTVLGWSSCSRFRLCTPSLVWARFCDSDELSSSSSSSFIVIYYNLVTLFPAVIELKVITRPTKCTLPEFCTHVQ